MTFMIVFTSVKVENSKSLRYYGKRKHLQTLQSSVDAVLHKLPTCGFPFVSTCTPQGLRDG